MQSYENQTNFSNMMKLLKEVETEESLSTKEKINNEEGGTNLSKMLKLYEEAESNESSSIEEKNNEEKENEDQFSIENEIKKLKKKKAESTRFFWNEIPEFEKFFIDIWMKIKVAVTNSPVKITDIVMKTKEYKNLSNKKPTRKQMIEKVRTLNRRENWKGDKNGRVKKDKVSSDDKSETLKKQKREEF